jgi:acyl-CoA synthetase (AMP-forming)/AMP-acid ligase II
VNEALGASASTRSGVTFVDLRERETFVSYREVHERARRTAASLRALGIDPGDRVAIVFPTSPAFLDSFFGVLLAGAVPVPLYPPVRLGRLAEYHVTTARMIAAVGARLVLADGATRLLLGKAVESALPPLGCVAPEALPQDAGELETAVSPGDLGLIQFSSGSTRDPRPVALSHDALMAQLAALRALLPPEDGSPQKGVSWLPLYHDMGLIGCLLQAVYYPGSLVLIPPELFLARPALWLRAIARHRATISVAPSFAYSYCARRVRDEDLAGDLSSWRLALCGAEPVSLDSLDHFARRFSPFGFDRRALRPVYGLAEASLAVTFSAGDRDVKAMHVDPVQLAARGEVVEGARAIVSVGTPVPGTDVEVRSEGGVLGERRVGRIFVRGPSVMVGYFGQAEATSSALAGGWLDTGDLGFVAGGELHVCGRAKNVIVIRGANHLPQEFEECLAEVEGVRAGCAVAVGFVPDGEDGEQLLILAERAPGGEGDDARTADSIRRAVVAGTGIVPHTVRMLEPGTLPRTSSGKLRRNEALRRFLAEELEPPASVSRLRILVEIVRSALAFTRSRVKARLRRGD